MWKEAARKIHSGSLGAIFIECSYDSSQPDSALYGHLSPAHLIAELKILGGYVENLRRDDSLKRKRKRMSSGYHNADPETKGRKRSIPYPPPDAAPSPAATTPPSSTDDMEDDVEDISPTAERSVRKLRSCPPESPPPPPSLSAALPPPVPPPAPPPLSCGASPSLRPLNALKIVITHVKDTMTEVDVPAKVLADLETLEREAELGCIFMLAKQGASIYF